ncbi:hypothetical protein GuL6_039 [Buttiauxella phage vB_ButM_GuL6]|nr:hypothetical protein GuL6_039 [Buttiauxella phage vB_ButM_GuL6]
MTIQDLLDFLTSDEHFIISFTKNEIVLSLTCNLNDDLTYSYARSYFPNFYKLTIEHYENLCEQLNKPEHKGLYETMKTSLDVIKKASVSFNERLERVAKING